MEIKQARAGQVETHKSKLEARKSLGNGGSLLASDALQKIKNKRKKEADDTLRKAKTAITRAENKAKNKLHDKGVQARKDEKARLLMIQQYHELGICLPDNICVGTTSGTHCYCNRVSIKLVVSFMLSSFSSLV
jgi:hypothetical protein